jgi:hypothetical protein
MRIPRNCGREDQVGKAAIERLAGPLCGLLDPGRAAALRVPACLIRGRELQAPVPGLCDRHARWSGS